MTCLDFREVEESQEAENGADNFASAGVACISSLFRFVRELGWLRVLFILMTIDSYIQSMYIVVYTLPMGSIEGPNITRLFT